MFLIPGILISLLTFPGVIIHEWAHKFFCDRFGVRVHKVVYFQFSNPVGYVTHEQPTTYKQTFWISVGPLIVNSIAAIALSFIATQTVSGGWLWYFLLWIAISAGMHAFPSDQDMQHVASASKTALKDGGSFLHYLSFPFVELVWIANKLRFVWFDAFYAVLLISFGGGFFAGNALGSTNTSSSNTPGVSVVVGQYTCASYDATQADSMQPSLSTSQQIDTDKQNLDAWSTRLDTEKGELDSTNVDQTDQTAIDKYNSSVDDYNNRLASYKKQSATLSSQIAAYNAQVDAYNAFLDSHCTKNQ